jgi:hypothetical protein
MNRLDPLVSKGRSPLQILGGKWPYSPERVE